MFSQEVNYLAGKPDGKIQAKKSTRAVGNLEVVVKVSHSGLCGTDVHDVASGCGLGHEGVGHVRKIGESVTAVKIGQRVGWGWQFSSCGHCRECIQGYRQYCPESQGQKYGELEQGAFGDYVIKHQDFVYPIPDEIDSIHAGPLQCAGVTVYEALSIAGTKPADRVGIIGLGGLGHLAVQYAKAMGCSPVVFSRDENKHADAFKLGADGFCIIPASADEWDMKTAGGINLLLLTSETLPPFEIFMPVLARRATIIPLAIQGDPIIMPYMSFLLPGHRIIGSTEASRINHISALTFAARHNIKPWIEEFPMTVEGLQQALERLRKGEVRYRAVLVKEGGVE